MFEDDFDEEYPRKGNKPFLPDLHLKSALVGDVVTELGDILTGKLFASPDPRVKHQAALFKNYLERKSRIIQSDVKLVYGEDSVPFIVNLWSGNKVCLGNRLSILLQANKEIMIGYMNIAKKLIISQVESMINLGSPSILVEKLIEGIPKNDLKLLIESGQDFLSSYKEQLISSFSNLNNFKEIEIKDPHQVLNLPLISTYFFKSDRLMCLRNKMMKKQIKKEQSLNSFNIFTDGDGAYTDQYCLVLSSDNIAVLLSYDQLLLCVDTVSSRFLTHLFLHLYPDRYSKIFPPSDIVQQVYEWGDDILIRMGNKGYDVIKKLEPACIAVFLRNWDKLLDSHHFLQQLSDDCEEEYRNDFLQLIKILNRCDHPNQIFEIFGLYRHMGHPIVDEEEGCKAMRSITREEIRISSYYLKNCLGACKKSFLVNYIKLNKSWPNIDISNTELSLNKLGPKDLEKERFMKFLREKAMNINEYEFSFPLNIWSTLVYAKCFDYNDYEDFTPLLSDTAISPERDDWLSIYNPMRLKVVPHRKQNYSRRTLVQLVSRREYSNKAVRKTIQSGRINKNWKIVALHSKEREMKRKARLFAMMVLEMRMWFSSSEKNISDFIFKYVPNQTMTNSEAELNNKLLNITNLKFKKGRIPVTFSLDMDKFNNRWRKESTDPFFEMLDNLFGTPGMYTYTHRFFEEAYFCLSSHNHPPEYLKKKILAQSINPRDFYEIDRELQRIRAKNYEKESETTWDGQGGGCEGLRQKGWTFIITSALSATEEVTGISSYIIGQADNQVIVALFPMEDPDLSEEEYLMKYPLSLTNRINEYKRILESHINGLGMKLKLEETWVSTKLMNYGKEILVDGCYMTGALKRISRSYSEVNEVHPTLSTRISSLFSSGHSAASKSFDPVIPYLIVSALALYTIDQEVKGKGISSFNIPGNSDLSRARDLYLNPLFKESRAIIWLNLNKEIGGYPVMPFTEYLFRGHPDQFSTYITSLVTSMEKVTEFKKILKYIETHYKLSRDQPIKYQKLIQDPTSLNWKCQNMDTGEISKMLDYNLQKITANNEIRKLLTSSKPEENQKVIDYLMTTTPLIPRVLNEIFRQSPEGAKLHYLSIFSDMKTMKEMMSSSDANKLIDYIESNENEKLMYVFNLSKVVEKLELCSEDINCRSWLNSFSMVNKITNFLWDKEVEGSRIPHPGQQFLLSEVSQDGCALCNMNSKFFQERIDYIFDSNNFPSLEGRRAVTDILDLYYKRGPFQPYTGSTTREKRSKSLINFPKGDRALLAAQNLFRIQDWVVSNEGTLKLFIQNLIKSRTEIPLSIIKLASGKYYGGSVIHRFQDVVTKHSCRPNSRPNLFSHIYVSSDKMGDYSGGKENYYIHFQSVFLYGLSLINMIYFWQPEKLERSYHLHVCNYDSLKPIGEELIYTNNLEVPTLQSLKGSVLLYSTFTEYAEKSSDIFLGETTIRDPTDTVEVVKAFSDVAAGTIMYGYMMEQSIPMIQGETLCNIGETVHCSLTIDDFITLTPKRIFQSTGSIWFFDNSREILNYAHSNNTSITDSIEILIKAIPSGAFQFIRSTICSKKVLSLLLKDNPAPLSNDYNANAKSLDKIFKRFMIIGAKRAFKEKVIWNKVIPYKSLSINRSSLLYFYSLVLASNLIKPVSYLKYIDLIRKHFYYLREQSQLTISNVVKYYNHLSTKDARLKPCLSIDKLEVSVCGPESWIKSEKNILKRTPKIQPSIIPLPYSIEIQKIREKAINTIKTIYRDLDLRYYFKVYRVDVVNIKSEPSSYHLRKHIPETLVKNKLRATHINRLTGIYSTAHYKYSEIFAMLADKHFQVSVNLAEGAGGVAKLCCQWFSCSKVIYNSLLDLNNFVSQRAIEFVPAELSNFLDVSDIPLIGVEECLRTGGDLTRDEVKLTYKRLIKKHVTLPSIMTMDAEIAGILEPDEILTLVLNTFQLFKYMPEGSVLILKTFYWYYNLFNYICGIAFMNFSNLEVVKPFFSSPENTEIFLVVRKLPNVPHSIVKTNHKVKLNLSDLKIRLNPDNYFTDILALEDNEISSLHKAFQSLYYRSNFQHSLLSITDNFIDEKRFKDDPLLEISSGIDNIISLIRYKLYNYGRDLRRERVVKVYSLIKAKSNPESSNLDHLSKILINLYILRDLFLTHKLDTSWVDLKIKLNLDQSSDDETYTISLSRNNWEMLFQRYFMRILGHLHYPFSLQTID